VQLNALVDIEVVAVEQPDELTVLLELTAPAAPADGPRAPAAVQVVLDRSGSMAGERLEAAQRALTALVDRLDPQDHFGVVGFHDTAEVVVPAAPVANKPAIKHAIASLTDGYTTNLSAGLLRGLQEAKRVSGDAGGQGGHAFARTGDEAAGAVAGEVAGLLSKTVQAASLTIRPAGPVASISLWNDLPSHGIDGGVIAELGDLWAGEQRKVLITLAVPAMPALGLAQVATLELTYVGLRDLVEETITVPLHVNVVPGDEAAGRVPHPKVHGEMLFQRAQEAKRQAAEALSQGDPGAARAHYRAAVVAIGAAAPDEELAQEAEILAQLDASVAAGEADLAAKASRMEHARKSRQRGRHGG
jgi:Ca-activated chloride channel family protein